MLTHLSIRDFAIIDELNINFGAGLNAITGETGAGKSIIVDALGAVLGDRTSSLVVRTGAERATIDAAFDLEDTFMSSALQEYLRGAGIDEGDTELILSREISAAGRSLARINGRPVTAKQLASLGTLLVDIHGQSDHLSLLKSDVQLRILDEFGVSPQIRRAYREAYAAWREARAAKEVMAQTARERSDRIDLLRYQVNEISESAPVASEDEDLVTEIARLTHADRLRSGMAGVLAVLASGASGNTDEAPGAEDQLRIAAKELMTLSELDPSLSALAERLNDLLFSLDEIVREGRDYGVGIEIDPDRLDEAMLRLDLLNLLKKKYGPELSNVLSFQDDAQSELDQLVASEVDAETLVEEEAERYQKLLAATTSLSAARKHAADELERAAAGAVADLKLGGASLTINSLPRWESGADQSDRLPFDRFGGDNVAFMFAPNLGESLRPLAKIASGGEMARIMLALKSVVAETQSPTTMVFDEVDVGIGGRSAQPVGEKLAQLSDGRQVIVITHLPQVASYADQHFKISKLSRGGRVLTQLEELSSSDRVEELAAMIDGMPLTDSSRQAARDMLARTTA